MFKHHIPQTSQQYDLGDGLIARWSTPEDTEQIAWIQSHVFRGNPEEEISPRLTSTVRNYMRGDFPLMGPNDFAVVEDTRLPAGEQRIVAATCLLREQWDFAGIPLMLGRPELVVSHPDYRNKGMIRAIFDLLHSRSEAEGHLVQGITGIPYFYRQFGYEFALELTGQCRLPQELLPALAEGSEEPFRFRNAELADIPFLQEIYDRQRVDKLVTVLLDQAWWEYQFHYRDKPGFKWNIQIVMDQQGQSVGFVILPDTRGHHLYSPLMAFVPGINLQALLPSLLRGLKSLGEQLPPRIQKYAQFKGLILSLPREHPILQVLGNSYGADYGKPYAWYLRVNNLPHFLHRIKPVLEQRLAVSPLSGYSGDLKLDFYRGGLRLTFEQGRIATIEDWRRPVAWEDNEESGFPPKVFWQILFGYRSLEELEFAYPDVSVKDEYRLLLKTLFPKQNSWAFPLG
ncbi:MAG TPA: GNAT family N-acetyltransferase [Ktedonobacteraceae bacterium]|nr:GNAT family N-acetyltransferase [Ktedonobacteraceae bacterium]